MLTGSANMRVTGAALTLILVTLIIYASPSRTPSLQAFKSSLPNKLPGWLDQLPELPEIAWPLQQPVVDISKDNRQTLRRKLDASTHSSTLTFDHIYVVSLEARPDRRATMSQIAKALDLEITFVNAQPKDSAVIKWIGERVFETRQQKRPFLAKVLDISNKAVGGLGIGSIWLARNGQRGRSGTLQLPASTEDRWQGLSWTEYLDEQEIIPTDGDDEDILPLLTPDDPSFNITAMLWDKLERMPARQVNDAVVSTWHSHLRAMKLMQENDDASALVLEDDVDIEWDIERLWTAIERKLPKEGRYSWDIAYLGHCWSRESSRPTGLHPALFYSESPRCLHGYALSREGYSKLLSLLQDPWSAYQAPIDVAIPTLYEAGLINSYSVDPPLILQAKDSLSDIQSGIGSKWRGLLADSTLDRIWRDAGLNVQRLTWEDESVRSDPYVWRPNIVGQEYR